jgi:hypothetical protein
MRDPEQFAQPVAGDQRPQAPTAGLSTTDSNRLPPRRARVEPCGDNDGSGHGFGRSYSLPPTGLFRHLMRGPDKPAYTCLQSNANPDLEGRISAF